MEDTFENKEYVRSLIRMSFPSITERVDLNPLSHSECVYMRSHISMVSDDDIVYYIRQLFEDLLDTHTGILGKSEDAEAVIQFLNVSSDYETDEGDGECGFADEQFLSNAKHKTFTRFTPSQAKAICAWLRFTKSWLELKWYVDDIQSAIDYWMERQ